MSEEKLQNQIAAEYGNKNLRELKIPSYIVDNLNKELRDYQIQALKYYLANHETLKKNHLLFNMATGSGKTLVMAALMLDLYQRGYRNFVFFVDKTTILEKTKANFCDDKSSKFLFKRGICINGKNVELNIVSHFNDSKEEAINIYFSTTPGLYCLFKNEKEGSLTLEDLRRYKIVFLADEAHHLNAETKKKLSKEEKEQKQSWESIIKNAFESNKENFILEFTATVPNDNKVKNKYKDKIIYEYDLKNFYKEGYAKKILLVKYDDDDLKARFLGACLLSVYRELLARKYKIFLKPVVLFKSEKKDISKENQAKFNVMLENLKADMIEEFYKNINQISNEFFSNSLSFFKKEFGKDYKNSVAEFIKVGFKKNFQLNANDDKEIENNRIKLNSLEDKDNEVRVIFAVNRLSEGWDVLNLYDIVRLNGKNSVGKNNAETTTSEVQLIGRGARYYPFGEPKFQRKFDNALEFDERSALEILSYHSLNEVEFISGLEKELSNQGLFELQHQIIKLEPSKRAKELTSKNKIFYVKNERFKKKGIFAKKSDEVVRGLESLRVPYFSSEIIEKEENFEGEEESYDYERAYKFGEKLSFGVMIKAMNMLKISMRDVRQFNPSFKSKKEFYESYLQNAKFNFSKKQKFKKKETQLQIAKFILNNFQTLLRKKDNVQYEVSEFKAMELKKTGERILYTSKEFKDSKYEWLYYTKWSKDSEYEEELLKFIESKTHIIDAKFKEWIVIRNDGFDEFKIYDEYGRGFEPDFIFFGKKSEDKNERLGVECIMEAKGEHLAQDGEGKDQWKEDLLIKLHKKQYDILIDDTLQVLALPFFSSKDRTKFQRAFERVFENSLFEEE